MTKADKNKIPGKKNFNGIERLVKYVIAIASNEKSKNAPISYSFLANAL